MIEKNKESLDNAIRKLPNYKAPTHLWDSLSMELENHKEFSHALSRLPTYQAPGSLWDKIDSKLEYINEEDKLKAAPKVFTISRKKYINFLRYAAIFLVIVSIGFATNFIQKEQNVSYASAFLEPVQFESFRNQKPLHDLKQMFQEKMKWSNDPSQQVIWNELADIESAIIELKQNMGQFEDENIQMMLRNLENDKSKILKQMIKFI